MPQPLADAVVSPTPIAPRLVRSALWNLLGDGLPMLAGIVTIRLLIPRIQDDRYTVLSLAWTAIVFFGMFDLGLGRALTQGVSRRIGAGAVADLGPMIWTALGLILTLGAGGGLAMAMLTPDLVRWLGVPAPLTGEARGVFYLLALALPMVILTTGLRGLLEAFGRFGLLAGVRITTSTTVYLLPLLLLPVTHNLVFIVGALVAVRLAGTLLHLLAYVAVAPTACRRVGFDRAGIGELLGFGGWITGSNVIGPILVYVDRFVIAKLVYFDAVAYYGTPCDLVIRLLFIPASVAAVLFPTLSAGLRTNVPTAVQAFERGGRFIYVLLLPVVVVIVAMAPEGINLWLGPAWAAHSGRVMQILAIGLFIGGMTQGPIALLHAAGRPDITACWHFAELPLYLGTLLLLTYKWGIQGAAVALVVRVAADYVVLGVASSRLVRQVGPSVRRLSVATALGVAALVSLACIGPLHFRLILGGVYLLGFVVIIYSRPSRNEKAKWLWRAWAVARS